MLLQLEKQVLLILYDLWITLFDHRLQIDPECARVAQLKGYFELPLHNIFVGLRFLWKGKQHSFCKLCLGCGVA